MVVSVYLFYFFCCYIKQTDKDNLRKEEREEGWEGCRKRGKVGRREEGRKESKGRAILTRSSRVEPIMVGKQWHNGTGVGGGSSHHILR